MKNLIQTSLILSAILAFAACQKQSVISPRDPQQSGQSVSKGKPVELTRIKTRTISSEVRTYTYDANGRSLGFTSNTGNQTYQYPDATHVIETPPASNVVNHELNSKGLVVKSIVGANIFLSYFTYNAKKQVTQLFSQNNGGNVGNITYNYVNGNLDTQVQTNDGAPFADISYTYYTDKANVLDNDVFGESWRGVGSKNLVQSTTTHLVGIGTYVMNYTYNFDPMGRVIKVSRVQNGTALADIIYSY